MALNAEKYGTELVNKLASVTNKIDLLITEIASTSETSNIYWTRRQVQLKKLYEQARLISINWTNERIPIVYRDQIRQQFYKLKNRKIKPVQLKKVKFSDFINTNSVVQSLRSLLSETSATFSIGYLSGEKTIRRLMNLTQQIHIREKEIEKQIAQGFIEKGTVTQSVKRLQGELLKKSLNGQYITVINKNGDPMQFKVSTYSDMVAKTKLIEAQTQAVVNTTAGLGEDLVQVSSHNTETAYDAQFEGKIFSLSGNDPDFPIATDLPPFHPRCKHSISTVIKEGLEADGTLQEYIDFSNNAIEKHPTRKSHTPVSKRGTLK